MEVVAKEYYKTYKYLHVFYKNCGYIPRQIRRSKKIRNGDYHKPCYYCSTENYRLFNITSSGCYLVY